ncbi:ABC transporter permease subunit, partial [Pseudomonas syringae]
VLASRLGTRCALLSAVAPKRLDGILSRLMDASIPIPSKLLAPFLVSAFGSGGVLLICTAVLSYTPGAVRTARSLAVHIEALEYVHVARTRRAGRIYIACRESLPNPPNPAMTDRGPRLGLLVWLRRGLTSRALAAPPPCADRA